MCFVVYPQTDRRSLIMGWGGAWPPLFALLCLLGCVSACAVLPFLRVVTMLVGLGVRRVDTEGNKNMHLRSALRVARAVAQRTCPNVLFPMFLFYNGAYVRGLCHCSAFLMALFSLWPLWGSISTPFWNICAPLGDHLVYLGRPWAALWPILAPPILKKLSVLELNPYSLLEAFPLSFR